MPNFELVEPSSLDEALDLLGHDDPDVRPMGGGTALVLMMKARFLSPTRLVSLRRVPGLSGLEINAERGEMCIGAVTTFAELEHSAELTDHLPVIGRAMRDLANVRVRNVATVGGNLAHADPHLDLPPIWAALGAQASLTSRSGTRTLPVENIALGYYETCIADGEIISGIRVPLRSGWHSTYVKVTTRATHDWPALGLAISARFEDAAIAECRIVLSAATDRTTRLGQAEAALSGAEIGSAAMFQAAQAAVEEAGIESDDRGSRDYKSHLLGIHFGRALRGLFADSANGTSHAFS